MRAIVDEVCAVITEIDSGRLKIMRRAIVLSMDTMYLLLSQANLYCNTGYLVCESLWFGTPRTTFSIQSHIIEGFKISTQWTSSHEEVYRDS